MAYRRITARYDGRCTRCKGKTLEGDPLYWDSDTRLAMHPACFDEHSKPKGNGNRGLDVEDLPPVGSLAAGVAKELAAEDTAILDLGDVLGTARKNGAKQDLAAELAEGLENDIHKALNGGPPIRILEWRKVLEKVGVPCAITALPAVDADDEDIDDIAGWSEVRVDDLYLEARELLVAADGLGTRERLDRLQEIVDDLAARAKGNEEDEV